MSELSNYNLIESEKPEALKGDLGVLDIKQKADIVFDYQTRIKKDKIQTGNYSNKTQILIEYEYTEKQEELNKVFDLIFDKYFNKENGKY
jgi:hypothetical protein